MSCNVALPESEDGCKTQQSQFTTPNVFIKSVDMFDGTEVNAPEFYDRFN